MFDLSQNSHDIQCNKTINFKQIKTWTKCPSFYHFTESAAIPFSSQNLMSEKSKQEKTSPHTEMENSLPMSLKSGLWMMNGQKFKDTRKKRQTIIECPALLLLLHQILCDY